MKIELDTIWKALKAAPTCEGLAWGEVITPANPPLENIDAELPVAFNGAASRFHVHVKRHLHRAAIERIIALKNTMFPALSLMLVSGHVTATQAEMLRKNKIAFLDTAGNACLDLPGLHLFVAGKGKPVISGAADPARTFHRAGIHVIFAFLTDPDLDRNPAAALLNQTFRAIRGQTGVALGSIGAIFGNLSESGYIVEDQNLRFLTSRQQLFEKWVAAYVDRLRPKLVAQRYRSKGGSWWTALPSLGAGNYWGGEVAAAKLTGRLKPELAALYSRGGMQRFILDADLRPDPKGDVEVLKVFWGEWPYAVHRDCVHPLLVYADLMASGIDRNMEVARRVYEQHLRDIIEPRG